MNDWLLYIFKRNNKHYLVATESEEFAWEILSKRQSMSIKNCKKKNKLLGIMGSGSEVWKI